MQVINNFDIKDIKEQLNNILEHVLIPGGVNEKEEREYLKQDKLLSNIFGISLIILSIIIFVLIVFIVFPFNILKSITALAFIFLVPIIVIWIFSKIQKKLEEKSDESTKKQLKDKILKINTLDDCIEIINIMTNNLQNYGRYNTKNNVLTIDLYSCSKLIKNINNYYQLINNSVLDYKIENDTLLVNIEDNQTHNVSTIGIIHCKIIYNTEIKTSQVVFSNWNEPTVKIKYDKKELG